MLRELSKRYDVYLGAFVDDPFDWQYAQKLEQYCAEHFLLNQNKLLCKIKGLRAFVTGTAISLPYYADRKMQNWVDKTLEEHDICKVFVYSSVMAQFVNDRNGLTRVVDFVDVDSDKWRQYAEGMSGVGKWVYSREHLRLQQFENQTAHKAHHSLFVSPQEAQLFSRQIPAALHHKVSGMLNGVDIAFFDPGVEASDPQAGDFDVAFTGAMDYWANVDAVLWFVKHVWPKVRQALPKATFAVVGGNPTAAVQALNGKDGIVVTGRVKDVRPFIRNAKTSVAPLQIARGIQNKVLEAMAMAKPVVATSMAMEGIETTSEAVFCEDDPAKFAEQVIREIGSPSNADENRQWIVDNVQWSASLSGLTELFEA